MGGIFASSLGLPSLFIGLGGGLIGLGIGALVFLITYRDERIVQFNYMLSVAAAKGEQIASNVIKEFYRAQNTDVKV